jgi:glutamate carboxypeptidase
MPATATGALLDWLEDREEAMVALLQRLAEAESPSLDARAQRRPLRLLARQLERAGLETRPVHGHGVGDHLYARPRRRRRGAPRQLLLGHVDTVWPRGTVGTMPVRRSDGLLLGPGVVDMKAGLVQLAFALRALAACGLEPPASPVVLVNTDEELGSPDSTRLIGLLAKGAARAFVLEAAEGPHGRLKIARKGVGSFTVIVRGRAAHSGTSFEEGVSAILELSRQVQRLFELNDPARGITVNVGTIDGGLRPNVVAPVASAVISVRAPTAAAAARVEQAIRSLRPTLPGARIEVNGGFARPPMEAGPGNRRLLARAIRLADELGLEVEDAGLVGGGSDANTASLYAPTLDGLGPVGGGSHASDERIVVAEMPRRAALLALLLLEPLHDAAPTA